MSKKVTKRCRVSSDNLLVLLTISGVIIGLTIGVLVSRTHPSQDAVIWIGLPGDVYMNSLKMVILPLIICSVIVGSASTDPKINGKISLVSILYIVITNSLACIIPILITMAAKPGKGMSVRKDSFTSNQVSVSMETIDVFADLIRNLFPPNIIAACFEQSQTKYKEVKINADANNSSNSSILESTTVVKEQGSAPSTNVLGLVICSFIIGMATAASGEAGKAFFVFFQSANTVIMKTLSWLVWSTPIGVASLIAKALLQAKDLESVVQSLGWFSLTIAGCLLMHVIVLVFGVHLILLRSNPFRFFKGIARPALVAGSTTSTAIAIPDSIRVMEGYFGLDSRVTRFFIPLATTINRDGSSIFIGCSVVFISQIAGEDFNAGQVVVLWALITFISMAIPSVPSASIIVISIVLSSLGKSTQFVGLLFASEWLLDRFRTLANLISHLIGTEVTYHFCKGSLPPITDDVNHLHEELKELKEKDTAGVINGVNISTKSSVEAIYSF